MVSGWMDKRMVIYVVCESDGRWLNRQVAGVSCWGPTHAKQMLAVGSFCHWSITHVTNQWRNSR